MSIAALLMSANVFAETAVCNGPVERLSHHEPGGLYLKVAGSGIMKICDPQVQHSVTTPENCKMIIAMAMMARSQSKNLIVYVDNAPTTACTEIPDWHEARVRFVEVQP
jgi:hypothetical protein